MVASLSEAKHRKTLGLFKAEGTKCVLDTLGYFQVEMLLATDQWLSRHSIDVDCEAIAKVTAKDLERMSSFSTHADVIAVYRIPEDDIDIFTLGNELTLALDTIQDPGNLGTIIRTADWFGIRNILCSHETVDVYNPKVVQSTMGAISRVKVHYCQLVQTIGHIVSENRGVEVYGTFLDGDTIYNQSLPQQGIIVMGNEGKGISKDVAKMVTSRLFIPPYPADAVTSESLNVAIATAIVLSQFRKNG